MGAGAGAGDLHDDVSGWVGSGVDFVGRDCGAEFDANCAELRCGPMPDHTPHQFKNPAPQLAPDTEPTDGPVRISVVYRIPVENYAEFTRAIHQLRGVRLRDGAVRWGIYRDAIDPENLNETFIMESWIDYLRSRERITAADEAIRARVRALHRHDDPPKTSYQIYAREIAQPTAPEEAS
jgi:hypothetical protein